MVNVFAVPVFFICFRECLETVIIVSVLLAFIKQTIGPDRDRYVYRKLVKQVWFGVLSGLAICLAVGAGMIGAFYGIGKNFFTGTEDLWEGIFGLIATIIISLVGAALLRISKLQDKWRVKLAIAMEKQDLKHKSANGNRFKLWCEKYAMFLLPFVTVLREGLEAVIFIGGVGLGLPAESFPLAVICGIAAGCAIGYLIYRGGNSAKLQIFLVISTCFLYLVAAGLFSKAVWRFQMHAWVKTVGGDAAETGSGPGSYNIHQSVWHVNCCNPQINGGGGWGVFNSLFGWTNSATYGSVIAYNVYWLAVIIAFVSMRSYEKNGNWPFMSPRRHSTDDSDIEKSSSVADSDGVVDGGLEEKADGQTAQTSSIVREIQA